MNRDALRNFILDFYQAWRDRDETKIPYFYDQNVKAYVDFKEVTLNDMLNRLEFSKRKFSKSNYNLNDIFIDEVDGKIAVRMNQDHVLRDGLGSMQCEAIMLYKVVDHKIKEIWMSFYPNVNYLDNA